MSRKAIQEFEALRNDYRGGRMKGAKGIDKVMVRIELWSRMSLHHKASHCTPYWSPGVGPQGQSRGGLGWAGVGRFEIEVWLARSFIHALRQDISKDYSMVFIKQYKYILVAMPSV